MKPSEVLQLCRDKNIKIVDIKFMDFPGLWQHCSFPTHELSEASFQNGFGFDGSSIRGWQSINESDMLVVPDAATAVIDPFRDTPTIHLVGNIIDPITKEKYSRDPRNIAQKAEAYLVQTGIADTVYFGSEAEFFVFDDIRFDQNEHEGYYHIDSIEGRWNSGRDEKPNLGYKPRFKEGYFPVPPTDAYQDLRSEMVMNMEMCGLTVEAHHHEVATAGQMEIDIKYANLTRCADNIMLFKYIVKNTAHKHNKTVTFMPKPLYGDNGSGMHCHQSLWRAGKPLFAGNSYAGMSEMALHYIGGLLKHAAAVVAFAAPTTNSYKRLVPGFEAPVNLAYSRRNRSAAIRIPMYSQEPKAKRLEFRPPDPSCNPYLAYAAMMMAGLDGIQNKIDPGQPLDKDIYGLGAEELKKVPTLPGSLEESLNALGKDYEFLLKGDVFTEDVIHTWIDYKTRHEVQPLRMRPHPYEFSLYYDI
ncbi:MAG TPA: type I glutamate--ammonia ligase [Patescibacteria group bacterium]|jgi:glutamine synthetase|nr:type I glutamate--ammonia ligase [Patescibacteria group bacterium]